MFVIYSIHNFLTTMFRPALRPSSGWCYYYKKQTYQSVDKWKTNLMSLAIWFHLFCAQHVSDINISIFRSLRLCWWITTSVVLFSVRCVLELLLRLVFDGVRFAGFSLQNEHHQIPAAPKSSNTQRTENKTTDVVIHQHSRKLLKMDILMSETCLAHNKWNKIASDIKLVFHSSTTDFSI